KATKTPMIAMTTNSSTRVNAARASRRAAKACDSIGHLPQQTHSGQDDRGSGELDRRKSHPRLPEVYHHSSGQIKQNSPLSLVNFPPTNAGNSFFALAANAA